MLTDWRCGCCGEHVATPVICGTGIASPDKWDYEIWNSLRHDPKPARDSRC